MTPPMTPLRNCKHVRWKTLIIIIIRVIIIITVIIIVIRVIIIIIIIVIIIIVIVIRVIIITITIISYECNDICESIILQVSMQLK